MRDAKAPKEVLPAKDAPVAKEVPVAKDAPVAKEVPVAKEGTPRAPAAGAAKLGPPPAPGSTKTGAGAVKVGPPPASTRLGTGPAAKKAPPPAFPFADKPPGAAAADKSLKGAEKAPASSTAEKPAPLADKPTGADKPTAADKPTLAGAARGIAPERRRALEDSVITSAPKLPGDPAQRGAPAARPAPKVTVKTAPAQPPAKLSGDKLAAAGSDPSGVPALRPRRDHNKSPGFYSTVAPEHAEDAVAPVPFAPVPQKKATVGGLAQPPESGKAAGSARAESARAEELGIDPLAAELMAAGAGLATPAAGERPKLELLPEEEADPLAALSPMVEEDGVAPAQPCSTPPGSVAPLAREEKEETSPGLGHARSPHDPNLASQVSGTDLELLLAFALDLALGCASEAWFVPLRAAVGRLLAGEAAIRSAALEKALTTLANDLEQPGAFKEENRQRLYGHVVAVDLALSKRMDVTGQKAIRERLIVDQLLEEIAQAHPVLTRRLKEQGMVSLESLGRLSAADLSAKLEAPADTATQVAGILQGYLEARVQRGPTVALLGKSVALKERLSTLEASAEAFDRASEGEDSGARRRTRKQRQTDVTQLNLLLAEFGEAKTLAEIERCSVQAKIERIQRWIAEQEVSSGRRASKPSSPP